MRYPKQPPRTDPREQMDAYFSDFLGTEIANAIRRTSGGIGKNEDSQKASINSAQDP
jgi:hypothetical protein